MSTGAHCTDLLQPERWNARMSVNLVLPWLIEHLTDPQSGHGPAVVDKPTLAVYSEEQVCKKTMTLHCSCCCGCGSVFCLFICRRFHYRTLAPDRCCSRQPSRRTSGLKKFILNSQCRQQEVGTENVRRVNKYARKGFARPERWCVAEPLTQTLVHILGCRQCALPRSGDVCGVQRCAR